MGLQPLKSSQFAYGSEWYEVSDEYDASVSGFAGDFEYFGYVNTTQKWIIQRHQISTGAYRYLNGSGSYATNFALAITGALTGYDYYYKLFNTAP